MLRPKAFRAMIRVTASHDGVPTMLAQKILFGTCKTHAALSQQNHVLLLPLLGVCTFHRLRKTEERDREYYHKTHRERAIENHANSLALKITRERRCASLMSQSRRYESGFRGCRDSECSP